MTGKRKTSNAYKHGLSGHNRIRYFQLMDSIVTQIILDRRGITDNFDQKLGISVNQLVSKLVDQDRLALALEDAKQARHELEIVTRRKNELELEVGQKDSKLPSLVWHDTL